MVKVPQKLASPAMVLKLSLHCHCEIVLVVLPVVDDHSPLHRAYFCRLFCPTALVEIVHLVVFSSCRHSGAWRHMWCPHWCSWRRRNRSFRSCTGRSGRLSKIIVTLCPHVLHFHFQIVPVVPL